MKALFTRKFFEVVDNLIADFDFRFNKEYMSIVDVSKCLHPFDSFESFDKKDLHVLYNHFAVDFPGHNDEKLLLTEHIHYKNSLNQRSQK